MAQTRIVVPKSAKKGEIVEIKTLIQHPMETGYRRDNVGKPIPRHIVTSFTVAYAGAEVFRTELYPGVAANPYIAFSTIATETGDLVFTWKDDQGATTVETVKLVVT